MKKSELKKKRTYVRTKGKKALWERKRAEALAILKDSAKILREIKCKRKK